jgi:hypothetical protein
MPSARGQLDPPFRGLELFAFVAQLEFVDGLLAADI